MLICHHLGSSNSGRPCRRHACIHIFRSMCYTSAGAAKPAGKRPYEKWNDAEEDTFFLALKATAGCLPNVVCTAAANRIGTKDYIQVMMQCHEHLSAVQDGCQSCGVKS